MKMFLQFVRLSKIQFFPKQQLKWKYEVCITVHMRQCVMVALRVTEKIRDCLVTATSFVNKYYMNNNDKECGIVNGTCNDGQTFYRIIKHMLSVVVTCSVIYEFIYPLVLSLRE